MANANNSLAHTKWMCKYQIVFTPKYRRKIIFNQYKESIAKILRQLCQYKGVKIIEGQLMPDHLSDETQEALALQENFVLNKEALRKAGMAAADHFNDPYYDDVYSRSINGQLKESRYRFSKKNIDDLENIILSCSCMHSEDQAVSIILIEEMPAFFKDQKSLEDVIKIAQDRAQRVLDERK